MTKSHQGFPQVSLPNRHGAPIEIVLISQLGPGAGSALISSSAARQAQHPDFMDALDEPAARIGAMHPQHDDRSSLYTFAVDFAGHPFHRHAGKRVFTAISGSAGAELRFSTAVDSELNVDPHALIRRMHIVEIPPDCLFTVRFGRGVWHQFLATPGKHRQPALFAISAHADELEGALTAQQRAQVMANQSSIAGLTEVLPDAVQQLVRTLDWQRTQVARTQLRLHTPWQSKLAQCARVRHYFGALRVRIAGWITPHAYQYENASARSVHKIALPADSLLNRYFSDAPTHRPHHTDSFSLTLTPEECSGRDSASILFALLTGFMEKPPIGVRNLMHLRNVLVKPMGLRTASLGCPVSSLQQSDSADWFMQRFPVIAQQRTQSHTQVVLGADDKHLQFRSVVAVRMRLHGGAELSMSTRVKTLNAFGRFYLAAIRQTHESYVAPAMLRLAADYAVSKLAEQRSCAVNTIDPVELPA